MQQVLIALALLVTSLLTAQTGKIEQNGYKAIEVSVTNVTSEKGTVEFALYTKDSFFKEPLESKSAVINGKISTVIFENVPAGTYAIVCYHDINENKRMDFEMNGMPLEDYGATNNVMEMGPPTFENAKFQHGASESKLEIKF